MKKHIRYGIVLISLILVPAGFFYLLNFIIPFSENLHVREGVIHISPEDGESWVARLQGDWEFYWGELLTFHDLQSRAAAREFGDVPMVWNRYNGEEKLPGFGYATYVVEISGVPPGKQLGLIVPTTSTANRIFIDDELVYTAGSVSNNAALHIPSYKTGFIPFVSNKGSFHIIIQVSNFVYARGGLWHEPIMGEYQALKGYHDRLRQKDYFLFGGLLIMVLFHLLVFGFDLSDRSHLYLALLALNALVRILVSGNYRIYDFTGNVCFRFMFMLEYISFHWIATTFLLLIHTLFQKGRKNIIIKGVVANALLLSVYTIIIPIRFVSAIINYAQLSVIFSLFYGLFIVFNALLRSERGAGLIFVCGYLGTIMSLYDILFYNNLVKSYVGETTAFAIFISIFIQSSVIAARYALNTRRLQKLSGELVRLNVLKDEFLVNTSHELKTPLSSIIALSDSLMMDGAETISPVQLEAVSLIRTSARRLSHTVNDVLDIVKLRNKDLNLAIQALDLHRVCRSITGMFSVLAIPKGLKIQTDIPETLPLVLADENRLAQILYNLLDNALKQTDSGYITISAVSIESFVNVSVTDTGRGIDAALLDAILKAEIKEEKYLFTQSFDSGIGLALSRHLIEIQGGRLWAESQIGYGSSFHFSLPAAEKQNNAEIQQVQASTLLEKNSLEADFTGDQGKSAYTSRPENRVDYSLIGRDAAMAPHILVVGDDYINIRSAVALLQRSGYKVSTAFSGEGAVRLINDHKGFSLVILDIIMSGLSGYETTKIIRENKSLVELPLLMMTSRHWGKDIVKSLEVGANDYLPKPFETEEFLARVQTLVEMKNSADKALSAEMAFLQAQIKPHFLFNSLNTIISYCDDQADMASELLLQFSRYLRMSFDLKNLQSFIPFSQELEVIKAYISLEEARFKSRLEMVYDIDRTLQFKLPPLILQPLVENAVLHGIRKKTGKGRIILRVKRHPTEKRIFISVEDNGIGVAEDMLMYILVTEKQGIGLWNINRRLKRIYHTELILASKPHKGFAASFNIPLPVGEDYNA